MKHVILSHKHIKLFFFFSSSCPESEKAERAMLLNQLLHIKQKERNGVKTEDTSHNSHDMPDNIQPKIEFPESTQSVDSFSDNGNGNNEQVNGSEDYEVFTAGIPNGVVYTAASSSGSPRGWFNIVCFRKLFLIMFYARLSLL